MQTVYKTDMLDCLSRKLNIPRTSIQAIYNAYINHVIKDIQVQHTTQFLNICYFTNSEIKDGYTNTLAYVSEEIARNLDLNTSGTFVFDVLTRIEEQILDDVNKFYPYVIKGICKISKESCDSAFKLRLNKSTALGSNVRIHAVSSFKMRVEK